MKSKLPTTPHLHFPVPPVRTVYNGTESLSFLGPKIWDIVPAELKEVKTLSAFKC